MLPHVGKLYPGLVIDRILDLQLDQAFFRNLSGYDSVKWAILLLYGLSSKYVCLSWPDQATFSLLWISLSDITWKDRQHYLSVKHDC